MSIGKTIMRPGLILCGKLKTKIKSFKYKGSVPVEKADATKKPRVNTELFKATTLNKCVQILRNQYDGLLFDEHHNKIDVSRINTRDLTNKRNQSKNLIIFNNLMSLRQKDKKPVDRLLLITLLGIKPKMLNDKVLVTKQIELLLEQDNQINRAKHLLRLSFYKNPVSMNRVMEFILKSCDVKGDVNDRRNAVEESLKLLNDCKKWGYKCNEQTFVIMFSGISKLMEFGDLSDELTKRLTSIYDTIDLPSLSVFNATLECLTKNLTDNQFEAWESFNKLDTIKPSVQTFTIFLHGITKNYEIKFQKLAHDQTKPKLQRQEEIIQLTNELVEVSTSIFLKVEFKELDGHVMVKYIANFINNFHNKYGHSYTLFGLKQLSAWVPELSQLVDKHSITLDTIKNQSKVGAEENYVSVPIDTRVSKVHVNKFILQKFIEGLSQLDKPMQFVRDIWYILHDFAGIEFQTWPDIKAEEYNVDIKYDQDVDPELEVVDERIIQYILDRVRDSFLKDMKASTIDMHIIQYCTAKPKLITLRTYNTVLGVMLDEISYFHRLNLNLKQERKTLTKEQLEYLFKSLKHFTTLCPVEYKTKLDKVVNKIVESDWRNMRTGQTKVKYNEMLLESLGKFSTKRELERSLTDCKDTIKKYKRETDV